MPYAFTVGNVCAICLRCRNVFLRCIWMMLEPRICRRSITGFFSAETALDCRELSDLVGELFDATLDHSLWPDVPKRTAELVGGVGAALASKKCSSTITAIMTGLDREQSAWLTHIVSRPFDSRRSIFQNACGSQSGASITLTRCSGPTLSLVTAPRSKRLWLHLLCRDCSWCREDLRPPE